MKKLILKITISFLLIISIFKTGAIGSFINEFLKFFLGDATLVVSILVLILILISFINLEETLNNNDNKKKFIGLILMLTSIFLISTLIKLSSLFDTDIILNQSNFTNINLSDGIGLIQSFIVVLLHNLFGNFGIIVVSVVLAIVAIYLMIDVKGILNKYKENSKEISFDGIKEKFKKEEKVQETQELFTDYKEDKEIQEDFNKEKNGLFELEKPITGNSSIQTPKTVVKPIKTVTKKPTKKYNSKDSIILSNGMEYKLPPLDILNNISTNKDKYKELKKIAEDKVEYLMDALESFKIKAKVENIVVGATITRYELSIEKGQKVSRFKNLSDDLSMALAASSIRIEAPIPGKSLVGIEIPNDEKVMVGLKEVLESPKNKKESKIEVALGKNITGEDSFIDIAKTPHLLVAGATGSGKSVCINSIITSVLLKASPEEVKFLLVDPKKVELTPYEGIPHLLAPVVTDVEKATVALNKLVDEMEKRYELFTQTMTRNIESYNKIVSDEDKLPLIVAIIDELADLMMVASNDVEVSIARIAQKARAAGIHLILATQRPSTDVITGLIKANIPSRISFMVSSAIDSRTILSKNGAEKLLGHGDMLLSMGGSPNTQRIQGGYLSDEEISSVVGFIKEQFSDKDINEYYKDDFIKLESEKKSTFDSFDDEDPLTEEALEIGINANRISASLLQRRLKIGYNRASRIIEDLENQGKVSKPEGNKGRRILVGGLENEED